MAALVHSTQRHALERNRLFWSSRRGMLELDLILLPFVDKGYSELAQADKERYWKLLSCEDQDMFAWFIYREEPEDPDLQRIVQLVRNHSQGSGPQSP